MAESDGYGRFRFGVPPKTRGDLAFVQHMVAVLNARGRLGVVMPHGVFRGGAEEKIRRAFCRTTSSRPSSASRRTFFYGTGIPASILVLNRKKPATSQARVLFIDGSSEFQEGSNQNHLRDQDVDQIAKTFHAYSEVEKYTRVVRSPRSSKTTGI